MTQEENAYGGDTPYDEQRNGRKARKPSKCRDRPASESLAISEETRAGSDLGKKHCIRARAIYDNSVGPLHDPIVYRFPKWANDVPQAHHRTGWKWNIDPTYDFACPVVDSLEAVTHALRTTEYVDRDSQYHWSLEILGLRDVVLWEFARLNFIKTFLSKRKLSQHS